MLCRGVNFNNLSEECLIGFGACLVGAGRMREWCIIQPRLENLPHSTRPLIKKLEESGQEAQNLPRPLVKAAQRTSFRLGVSVTVFVVVCTLMKIQWVILFSQVFSSSRLLWQLTGRLLGSLHRLMENVFKFLPWNYTETNAEFALCKDPVAPVRVSD
jgi:hypothetical protein